jgi:hypothetical protein
MLKTPPQILELTKKPIIKHSFKLPAPYCDLQRELIESDVKLAVFCTGTKVGKSLGSSIRLARYSFKTSMQQDGLFRIISPTYKQAKIIYRYWNRLMPPKLPPYIASTLNARQFELAQEQWAAFTPQRSDAGLWAKWPHNGATIECMHGSDPEATIEGERVHGQIIDEAAKCKEQVFNSAMTTTTQTGGWTYLVSTPRGKGWFYRIAMEARDHEEWCRKRGQKPSMIFRTLPTTASPYVKPEIIENARRTMSGRLFRQLYEASFEDDGSVFVELGVAFQGVHVFNFDDSYMVETHSSENIFIGADWAKSIDYTVFIALNEKGQMLGWRRIQRKSFPVQVSELFWFADTLKARSTNQKCDVNIRHDQTGVGEAINDVVSMANTKGYGIEGVKWSNSLKEVYVNDLILSLEEHSLKLLPWGTLNAEMAAFEVETSSSGNPIYNAPEGQHDDTVMSIVLANGLFRNYSKSGSGVILFDTMSKEIEYAYYNMTGPEDYD